MSSVYYVRRRRLYKYRTTREYTVETGLQGHHIRSGEDEDCPWVCLAPDGRLTIRAGYSWDGPSGPTFDTRNWMRASLVHDALYQLMRDGLLDQSERRAADDLMRAHLLEDGMNRVRAWYSWRGVRSFGAKASQPAPPLRELSAP